jgi:hypothetical protein
MHESLLSLRTDALQSLAEAADADALEAWRVRFLGRKGALAAAMQPSRPSSKTGLLSDFGIQAMVSLPSSRAGGVSWALTLTRVAGRTERTRTTKRNRRSDLLILANSL